MSLCNRAASVVRPSVRPSVCKLFFTQIATSTTNMTRSPLNLHTMVPRWACIQCMLKVKVKVKGHVIRTLFWLHENRFFYHKHDSIATKLAHDGPQWSPDGPASRVCSRSRSRSKVTWYGHFCDVTKIASSRRQMAGTLPNLHMMVPSPACIHGMIKVKVEVKGHVIRALLWCHVFAIQYGLRFCLYMRSLYMKHHYTLLPA